MNSRYTRKQLREFLTNYLKIFKNNHDQKDTLDLEATQFLEYQMNQKITFPEFISNLTEQLTKYQKNLFHQITGSYILNFQTYTDHQHRYLIDLISRYRGVYQIETDSETQNKTLYMAFPGPSPAYCLFREFREYQKIKMTSDFYETT
tara:strand:- start:68 stop:511 length:444 start_codon:yes stop_codon:yes gene_type:complete